MDGFHRVLRFTRSRRSAKYFAWFLALSLYHSFSANRREVLSAHVRESGVLGGFLDDLVQHVPLEAGSVSFDADALSDEGMLRTLREADVADDAAFQVWASFLLLKSLETFPTVTRLWWQATDRHTHNMVERFTIRCLSPAICKSELDRVRASRHHEKYANFETRVVGNEVTASYEEDDVKLSIVLRLPGCYPLKPIDVGGDKKVGISEALWRRWLLSMATLLLTQDGTILDALLLWKNSLDSHFEGVDVCPICYSLFHPSSKSLPGMACKTCKNKFHSACLYKWFHTSHKSDCPLCRSPFIA